MPTAWKTQVLLLTGSLADYLTLGTQSSYHLFLLLSITKHDFVSDALYNVSFTPHNHLFGRCFFHFANEEVKAPKLSNLSYGAVLPLLNFLLDEIRNQHLKNTLKLNL